MNKRCIDVLVVQSLAVGLGVLGIGRGLFACNDTVGAPPRKSTPVPKASRAS